MKNPIFSDFTLIISVLLCFSSVFLLFPVLESIYNHINKGVDGFLLASETSIGKLPHRTVKLLNSIINMYKKNKSGDNNI